MHKFFRIVILKNWQNSQENTSSLFLVKLQACYFIFKRLQHRCFPVNFFRILRTAFFIEHLRRLLLNVALVPVLLNLNMYLSTLYMSWLDQHQQTCSKLAIKVLEQYSHKLFYYRYCWFWTVICQMSGEYQFMKYKKYAWWSSYQKNVAGKWIYVNFLCFKKS